MIDLKGLHKTSKKLASGEVKAYYYAWKGGPSIAATFEYGTVEFANEFNRLVKGNGSARKDTLGELIQNYREKDMPKKKPATRRSYAPILDDLAAAHGIMPIAAIEEMGSRVIFEKWRDKRKDTPRSASLAWTVVRRVFSFSVKAELLKRNPCLGGSGYAVGSRSKIIWTDAEIETFRARAPAHIAQVMTVALETGQRQGDILKMKWSSYDGKRIQLTQEKRGTEVTILVSAELRLLIESLDRSAITILTNSKGKPWTSSGFRASWRTALEQAGIKGKTFHDLRGTFITRARRSGSKTSDIASVTGHSEKSVIELLEKHYLADDLEVSDAVILKMERAKK